MVSVSSRARETLASKLLGFDERVDTEVMGALFDEILAHIGELKYVSCTLVDGSSLCLHAQGELIVQVKLLRAKSILRVMLARLSSRCSEWAKRSVSPYGDDVEFELPADKLPCKIKFKNTSDAQWFEISDASTGEATLVGENAKVENAEVAETVSLLARSEACGHCQHEGGPGQGN